MVRTSRARFRSAGFCAGKISGKAMSGYVFRINFIAFEMKQEVVDKYLFISALKSITCTSRGFENLLSIGEHDSHRVRITTQQIGCHHQGQIGRCHFCDRLNFIL